MADVAGGVIHQREEGRDPDHEHTEDQTAEHGDKAHFVGRILRRIQFSGAEYMSHHNSDSFTHGNEGYAHEIPKRRLNIHGGNGIQAPV